MARLTVDVEELVTALLREALPAGTTVLATPDVDLADRLPLVVVRPGTGRMLSNGAPGLGWQWEISLVILATGQQAASDLADLAYQVMHGMEDRQATIAGVGTVMTVEDVAMPVRTAMAPSLDNLTQFDGTWSLVVVPAS